MPIIPNHDPRIHLLDCCVSILPNGRRHTHFERAPVIGWEVYKHPGGDRCIRAITYGGPEHWTGLADRPKGPARMHLIFRPEEGKYGDDQLHEWDLMALEEAKEALEVECHRLLDLRARYAQAVKA